MRIKALILVSSFFIVGAANAGETFSFEGAPDEISSLKEQIKKQKLTNSLAELRKEARMNRVKIIPQSSAPDPRPTTEGKIEKPSVSLPEENILDFTPPPTPFKASILSIRGGGHGGDPIAFILFEGEKIVAKEGDLLNADFKIVSINGMGVSVEERGELRRLGFMSSDGSSGGGSSSGAYDSTALTNPLD